MEEYLDQDWNHNLGTEMHAIQETKKLNQRKKICQSIIIMHIFSFNRIQIQYGPHFTGAMAELLWSSICS